MTMVEKVVSFFMREDVSAVAQESHSAKTQNSITFVMLHNTDQHHLTRAGPEKMRVDSNLARLNASVTTVPSRGSTASCSPCGHDQIITALSPSTSMCTNHARKKVQEIVQSLHQPLVGNPDQHRCWSPRIPSGARRQPQR